MAWHGLHSMALPRKVAEKFSGRRGPPQPPAPRGFPGTTGAKVAWPYGPSAGTPVFSNVFFYVYVPSFWTGGVANWNNGTVNGWMFGCLQQQGSDIALPSLSLLSAGDCSRHLGCLKMKRSLKRLIFLFCRTTTGSPRPKTNTSPCGAILFLKRQPPSYPTWALPTRPHGFLQVIEVEGRTELEMYPLRLHVSKTDRARGAGRGGWRGWRVAGLGWKDSDKEVVMLSISHPLRKHG